MYLDLIGMYKHNSILMIVDIFLLLVFIGALIIYFRWDAFSKPND